MSGEYQNKLKLLCYNVFYKEIEERKDNIFEVFLTRDADVMLLQEVSIPWIPRLKEFMEEHGFSYYGYGRRGGEMMDKEMHEKEQFTPILWKTEKYDLVDKGHFFLSSTPEVFSSDWEDGTVSKFPRCVNWVILRDKATGGEVMALCIHTDPENPDVRTKSSELTVKMLEKIRQGRPLIMGGDWNMQPEDAAYKALIDGGYVDVRHNTDKTTAMGSFNAWGKRTPDNFAFGDYLFTSDNVKPEYFEVVDDRFDGVHASDHCPLETIINY